MPRLSPFRQIPGGLPPGVSRSLGPSSTIALAHCSPHLGARGAPTAAPSPPGRIRRRSNLQSGSDAAAPAAGAARQARGTARDTGSPVCSSGQRVPSIHQGPRSRAQRRLPLATAAPPVQSSCVKEQAAQSPGGSGSDGHFLTPAASREQGSVSPPLTTPGPQRDGEITGIVGTAPLDR
ncbi:hypothetical protein NDU88_002512 [Pleurodeles waltl]|uniref:Uncharacterized protein n=1 Tax=Pleurodeles waltl TaxID=8319 RepID=A0AAV7W490_PLEWA|nr:hypothetical protein NDU88_002512 [Pleurodeles waltl]